MFSPKCKICGKKIKDDKDGDTRTFDDGVHYSCLAIKTWPELEGLVSDLVDLKIAEFKRDWKKSQEARE